MTKKNNTSIFEDRIKNRVSEMSTDKRRDEELSILKRETDLNESIIKTMNEIKRSIKQHQRSIPALGELMYNLNKKFGEKTHIMIQNEQISQINSQLDSINKNLEEIQTLMNQIELSEKDLYRAVQNQDRLQKNRYNELEEINEKINKRKEEELLQNMNSTELSENSDNLQNTDDTVTISKEEYEQLKKLLSLKNS